MKPELKLPRGYELIPESDCQYFPRVEDRILVWRLGSWEAVKKDWVCSIDTITEDWPGPIYFARPACGSFNAPYGYHLITEIDPEWNQVPQPDWLIGWGGIWKCFREGHTKIIAEFGCQAAKPIPVPHGFELVPKADLFEPPKWGHLVFLQGDQRWVRVEWFDDYMVGNGTFARPL